MKRKSYIPPEINVEGVELESPICTGSVIMESTTKTIDIEDQTIDKDGAVDFTSDTWDK